MQNRDMGLGKAPGIDLHAIYNSHKPRKEKPKKMKKVDKPSAFSKAISEFKEQAPMLN